MGYGAITQFESGAGYDLVSGDATAAYGGALTRARRSLVYLRPYNVLVYDTLASDTPRTFEWNIHALNRMGEVGEGTDRALNRQGPAVRGHAGRAAPALLADRRMVRGARAGRAAMAWPLQQRDAGAAPWNTSR